MTQDHPTPPHPRATALIDTAPPTVQSFSPHPAPRHYHRHDTILGPPPPRLVPAPDPPRVPGTGALDLSNGHNPPRIESLYVLPLWRLNGIRGSGPPTDTETPGPLQASEKAKPGNDWTSFRASGVLSKPT